MEKSRDDEGGRARGKAKSVPKDCRGRSLLEPIWPSLLRVVIRRYSLLLLALSLLTASGGAAEPPPEVASESASMDVATGDIVLIGHPRLEWTSTLLVADEIRYNPKKRIAVARGHVALTRGPRRILADELTYHVQDQTFVVTNARMGEYPLYVTAGEISGGRNEVAATNAMVSYGEPYVLAPSLRAGKLVYIPNQSISAETARIGFGTTIPVSVPKFHQSLKEPLLSYFDVHLGYRASLGAHLGVGAQLPIWSGVKLGGDMGYYTKRGLLVGPSGTYAVQAGDQDIAGSFQSGYIYDVGNRLQDVLGRDIPQRRGYFEWTHHQDIGPDLTVFGQLRYWKDSEIIRDFRPEEFFQVQTPDSFFEGVYTGKNYVVSLFTRVQPNSYIRVQERLPELRFDLLPTPVGLGVYERFNASAAILRADPVADRPLVTSKRIDLFYGLNRPVSPREWLTFNPVLGGRLTHYADAIDGKDTYTRILGEVGFDANLQTSATYNYKNERWNIDGIRHLLTPRVSYRYIPSAEKGQRYIPQIDHTVFSTYLQPLDLGDQRNVDELQPTNTLRVGLDNTLQTRDKHYGSRDLLIFNVASDLRFEKQAKDHKFSAIHTEIAFLPAAWLRLDVYQSVDPKTFNVQELNTGVQIMDSNVWSLRFANRYLTQQIQEYVIDGKYRMTEAYQIFTRLHFDARENRFVERTIGLSQNLHNLWTIDYGVSFFSGRRRESNFGFTLRVNLIGLSSARL